MKKITQTAKEKLIAQNYALAEQLNEILAETCNDNEAQIELDSYFKALDEEAYNSDDLFDMNGRLQDMLSDAGFLLEEYEQEKEVINNRSEIKNRECA